MSEVGEKGIALCPLCYADGKKTPLVAATDAVHPECPVHGIISDELLYKGQAAPGKGKPEITELDSLFKEIDVNGKLAEALKDILNTDAREDQFRTLKILLLYQAFLLDSIAGKLDAIGSVLINVTEPRLMVPPKEEKP